MITLESSLLISGTGIELAGLATSRDSFNLATPATTQSSFQSLLLILVAAKPAAFAIQ